MQVLHLLFHPIAFADSYHPDERTDLRMQNILVKPRTANSEAISAYLDSPLGCQDVERPPLEWVKGEPLVEFLASKTLPHTLFEASLEDIEVCLSDYGCGERLISVFNCVWIF